MKPEHADNEDERGLGESHHDGRNGLADEDFPRRKRRDQHLIEGSLFPFSGHGKGGEQHDLNDAQRGQHAGHDVPARFELRIEPCPHDDGHGGFDAAGGVPAFHNLGKVALRDGGRGGIAAVENDLNVGTLAGEKFVGKVAAYLHGEQRLAVVDPFFGLGRAVERGLTGEFFRTVEAGDEVAGEGGAALIAHDVGHEVEVVGGRVAEDERLDDHGHDEHQPVGRILENDEQLFDAEAAESSEQEKKAHG